MEPRRRCGLTRCVRTVAAFTGDMHADGCPPPGIPRHISPHSLRRAAITNALDAGVPLRYAQVLGMPIDERPSTTTEPGGNLDRHGVHSLTAYVAGV